MSTTVLIVFLVVHLGMILGGFYTRVTERLAALPVSPPALLAVLVAATWAVIVLSVRIP